MGPLFCRGGLGGTIGVCGGQGLFLSLSISLLISSILRWSVPNSLSRRSFSPWSRFLSPTTRFRASWMSEWALAPAACGPPVSPPVSRDTSTSNRFSLAFRLSTSGPPFCGQLDSTGLSTVKVYWHRPLWSFPLHRAALSCASPPSRRPHTHKESRRNILQTVFRSEFNLKPLSEGIILLSQSPLYFRSEFSFQNFIIPNSWWWLSFFFVFE